MLMLFVPHELSGSICILEPDLRINEVRDNGLCSTYRTLFFTSSQDFPFYCSVRLLYTVRNLRLSLFRIQNLNSLTLKFYIIRFSGLPFSPVICSFLPIMYFSLPLKFFFQFLFKFLIFNMVYLLQNYPCVCLTCVNFVFSHSNFYPVFEELTYVSLIFYF